MSNLEKVRDFLKNGDEQTVVTFVGPVVRIERDGNVLEFAREHIGGVDWLIVRLNGVAVHQG
jgi:hypothetical protein